MDSNSVGLEKITKKIKEVVGVKPEAVHTNLGYRGVDAGIPEYGLKHQGKFKRLTDRGRRLLKRRSAVELIIGHLKSDHGMNRCHLKGRTGDARCTAGVALHILRPILF